MREHPLHYSVSLACRGASTHHGLMYRCTHVVRTYTSSAHDTHRCAHMQCMADVTVHNSMQLRVRETCPTPFSTGLISSGGRGARSTARRAPPGPPRVNPGELVGGSSGLVSSAPSPLRPHLSAKHGFIGGFASSSAPTPSPKGDENTRSRPKRGVQGPKRGV